MGPIDLFLGSPPGHRSRPPAGSQAQPSFRPLRLLLPAILGWAVAGCWAVPDAAGEQEDPGLHQTHPGAISVEAISVNELARRLQHLEEQNARLAEQNQSLETRLREVTDRYDQLHQRLRDIEPTWGSVANLPDPLPPAAIAPVAESVKAPASPPRPDPRLPPGLGELLGQTVVGGGSPTFPPFADPPPAAAPSPSRFLVGDFDEDRGAFVLVRPRDGDRTPFELRADLFTQARYTNFAPNARFWYDSTGTRRRIESFDSVEVMRNFVWFQGFALDPRLQFSTIIFSSTALNDTVYLGWINFRFNRALDLRVGNWLVPGTREWQESFRYTLGADRLMATTFFRPNISPGVWVQGEPIDNVHYMAMLANSFNRFTQGIDRIGRSRAFGGTLWWEPGGGFGPGPSDLEFHRSPGWRIGTSTAFSQEANQGLTAIGTGNPEDTVLRLSNGTPLFRQNALGPGTQLTSVHPFLWSLDVAFKYRGFALSGEYFLRWINDLQWRGEPPQVRSLFDRGGLVQGGYFVVPGKVELYGRTSMVTGRFGTGTEYGGGINWYPRGSREWRYTFEVLRIDASPAQNVLTGYRAGESGSLFQLQWFTDF